MSAVNMNNHAVFEISDAQNSEQKRLRYKVLMNIGKYSLAMSEKGRSQGKRETFVTLRYIM